MKRTWILAGGVTAGAAAMFLFDPANGRRRRDALRDGAHRVARASSETVRRSGHRLAHEARGIAWRLARAWNGPVPDEILAERVRSQVGHAVCHGGRIRVSVQDGRVTLSGPVFCGEVRRLLRRISRITGVIEVSNELEAYPRPFATRLASA